MSYEQMRKKEKAMTMEEIETFIRSKTILHLCLTGNSSHPYVVPLNYAYVNGKFILHSTNKGHKAEILHVDPRVCITISRQHFIETDGLIPCEEYKTPYTSIVAFGKAYFPEGNEKIGYLTNFVKYYMKIDDPPVTEFDTDFMLRTYVIVIEVDHITGKTLRREA